MNTKSMPDHPSRELWSAFFYGELPPQTQGEIERHLADCPDCRRQADELRQTMASLDAWKLAARPKVSTSRVPLLRWAVAAVILLGAGLLAGRLTSPRIDTDRLAVEFEQRFRAELQAATAAIQAESDRRLEGLAEALALARAHDQQTALALYQQAEVQRKTDLAWLRRDIEVLALNAEERLDTAQLGLSQLAAVSETLLDRPDLNTTRP
mgnify:CR=1 FL=1